MTTMTPNIITIITVAYDPHIDPDTKSTVTCTETAVSVDLHDRIGID